jgi:hypothetical protein
VACAAGKHKLKASRDGLGAVEQTVLVEPGKTEKVILELSP